MKISQIQQDLREKKVSSVQLVEKFLEKIKKSDNNSFLEICKQSAIKKAKQFDQDKNFSLPLAGIPISIKDVICTEGIKTTAGSKMLENFIPPFSATVVEKLEDAGAIILGKNNCDEFAMGSSTENSAFKKTKNPWNKKYVPGGSSGGSAAAVAAKECVFSIGTDTGGSIRQPANFCGTVGLKPTFGRVSRFGLIAYGSSFDCAGPITNYVEDAAKVLEIISGKDEKDATTKKIPVEKFSENLQQNITGKKIAIITEFLNNKNLNSEIKKEIEMAAKTLEKCGAKITEISIPILEISVPTYYILVKSEASTNLARFDGIRFGKNLENIAEIRGEKFGPEVKRAIITGTFALSAGYADKFYQKATNARGKIIQNFAEIFKNFDAILSPVSPTTAFQFDEKNDPLQMYLADIFTVSANLAGIPGIAVPTKVLENNLPTGIQILGQQFNEKTILNIAWHLENNINFPQLKND